LAIFPKIVLFSIFIKFLFLFYDILLLPFHFFCICCAFFSILFGAIGGLFQIKLKRLFAYSTIANVGFILLGFSLFNLIGCFSAFFYLFFYIIFLITFFSILLCLKRSNNSIELKKISDLKNLFIINPTLSLIFALTLFSFAGIPPLAGFFIKMFLFFSLLTNQLFFISIFLILVSGISCFYYIRLIKIMFFSNSINVTSWIFLIKINSLISYIIAVSFLVNIFFIFYPEFFLLIINDVIFSFYL
jgi:NADH-quinone oxidoreductase subunit N